MLHRGCNIQDLTPLRCRCLQAGEVLAPDVRDVLGREADEEHRSRRPRHATQAHARLLEEAGSLSVIAGSARGDDVLPHGRAPTGPWDDVVEGEPVAPGAAVGALPAVAGEQ